MVADHIINIISKYYCSGIHKGKQLAWGQCSLQMEKKMARKSNLLLIGNIKTVGGAISD